jgi:general secretion pathway protein G
MKTVQIIVCIFALIGVVTFLLPTTPNCHIHDPCRETVADLAALKTAVKMFSIHMGRLPTSAEGLSVLVLSENSKKLGDKYNSRGYIEHLPRDPWDNEYQYTTIDTGRKAIIWTGSNESCLGVNFVQEIELSSIEKL